GLQQQTPRLEQVLELGAHGIEPPRANQVARDLVTIVGACNLQSVSKVLRDGTDYHGQRFGPPPTGLPPAPEGDGGKRPRASARRMAGGIDPAVPTGDNGPTPDLNELFAEVVRAVHSVDNGPERATRGWYRPESGTGQPGQTDFR